MAEAPFAVSSGRIYWVDWDGAIRKRNLDGSEVIVVPGGDHRVGGVDAMAAFDDHLLWNDSVAGLFALNGNQVRSVNLPAGNWAPVATPQGFFARANDTPRPLVRIDFSDASAVEMSRESYSGWEICATKRLIAISGTSLRVIRLLESPPVEATLLSALSLDEISCSNDDLVGFSSDPDGGTLIHVSLLNGDSRTIAFVPYWSSYRANAIVGDSVFVLFGVARWPDGWRPEGEQGTYLMRLIRYSLRGGAKARVIDSWIGCPGVIHANGGHVFWTDPCEGVLNRIGPYASVKSST
ncbi:MAG: hypothetical protein IT370_35975 [Deltaproteobacteria bacterium]|nr:hypothetical protein [Deltaproteobacteria bacterium]